MPPRKTKAEREEEEREAQAEDENGDDAADEENGDEEEFDEDELEDQVEQQTGERISMNITDEVIEVVVPREGDPEKTLKAIGQLVKGLD
jgi:hypothetical protein